MNTVHKNMYFTLIGALFLLIIAMLCTGCGQGQAVAGGISTSTTPTSAPAMGTLKGTVTAGPTCPVQSVDNPCKDRPVPQQMVRVETSEGKLITTTTTDQQGQFRVQLAPGRYVLSVPRAGVGIVGRTQKTVVTVSNEQITTVHLVIDTGIR